MATDSILRRSWSVMTGTDRVRSAAASAEHSRLNYSLTRRVAAILLGVPLPAILPRSSDVGQVRKSAPATRITLRAPHRLPIHPKDDLAEYNYFLRIVKSYVAAEASDRIQSRLYALASLKNLDLLIDVTVAENSFRGLDTAFQRIATTFRTTDACTFVDLSNNWAQIRSCQHYFAAAHRRMVREAAAQVYSFTVEYRARQGRIRSRTERPAQFEHYMRLMEVLCSEDVAHDELRPWRSGLSIVIDPHVYDRGPAADLIRQLESAPSDKPEAKLEDARDALTVASHDFIGADLRHANLDDVPLGGIRWNAATRWPRSWLQRLRTLSTEVEPGILQVNGRWFGSR